MSSRSIDEPARPTRQGGAHTGWRCCVAPNLKTARAPGPAVPQSLLLQADEVIE